MEKNGETKVIISRKEEVKLAKKRIQAQCVALDEYIETSTDTMPLYAINIGKMIGVMNRNLRILLRGETPEQKLVRVLFEENSEEAKK